MPKLLVCDGYNLMHMARSGFGMGPAPVVFNFFRSFRSLVEKHKPSRIVFTLEGQPKKRLEALPTYKANREVDPADTKKLESLKKFHEQKEVIINLLKTKFPVSVVRHPSYEADDVINTIVRNASSAIDVTVVSSDTDFIQLLDDLPNVKLYNPVKKAYIERHETGDYVLWKSLKGDPTDNIEGFKGVGEQTASRLVQQPELLESFLREQPERVEKLHLNMTLVKLCMIQELDELESSTPKRDWDGVKNVFETYVFKSIVADKYWTKFVSTFDSLWRVDV